MKNNTNFAVPINNGVVAQLVEQRTENPCVTGSIPVDTTMTEEELERNVPILQRYQGFQEIGEIFSKLIFPKFAVIFTTILLP